MSYYLLLFFQHRELRRTTLCFPKLVVEVVSANKLLGLLGQAFPIPQCGFQFFDDSHSFKDSPVLLISLVVTVLLTPFAAFGLLPTWLLAITGLAALGPLAYLALLVAAGITDTGSLADRLRFVAVVATMHLSWGAGFLVGVVRGARDAVDTSRTES